MRSVRSLLFFCVDPRMTRNALSAQQLQQITEVCAAHHLVIRGARRHGVLLELLPEQLDDLPDAHTLRAIAEALAGDGVRYVALALDEPDDDTISS